MGQRTSTQSVDSATDHENRHLHWSGCQQRSHSVTSMSRTGKMRWSLTFKNIDNSRSDISCLCSHPAFVEAMTYKAPPLMLLSSRNEGPYIAAQQMSQLCIWTLSSLQKSSQRYRSSPIIPGPTANALQQPKCTNVSCVASRTIIDLPC